MLRRIETNSCQSYIGPIYLASRLLILSFVDLNPAENECQNNPCQNGGTCTDALGYYLCTCQDDRTGKNCERGMLDEMTNWSPGNHPCHMMFTELALFKQS